jgi:hypothetical protein
MKFQTIETRVNHWMMKANGLTDEQVFEEAKKTIQKILRKLSETEEIITPNPIEVKESNTKLSRHTCYRFFKAEVITRPKVKN